MAKNWVSTSPAKRPAGCRRGGRVPAIEKPPRAYSAKILLWRQAEVVEGLHREVARRRAAGTDGVARKTIV